MIEELLLPVGGEMSSCLVLQDHDRFDQGIGFENSNGPAAKVDNDLHFTIGMESLVRERDRHRIRVDRFQVPGSKLRIDLVKNTNDSICERTVKQVVGHVAFRCNSVTCRAMPWQQVYNTPG